MPGKHFDLDTDILLGGEHSSDITIASQKATKSYIDTKLTDKQDKLTAGTNITIDGNTISATVETAENLSELSDVHITSPSNGQALTFNSTNSKWENTQINVPTKTSDLTNDSGFITKSVNDLDNYTTTTSLNTALEGKANLNHNHTVSNISDFPTDVSAFNNDAGYLTEHQDISGKQDKITSTNKLSADLLSEGTTNKLVSATEKTTWNNKQNAISDLETIRNNATAGKNASDTIAEYGDIVTHNADEFLTEHQDISGKADKATTLAGYGITDAYTKTQIDGKLTGAMHYKGTVATVAALDNISTKETGDVYNVTSTGDNYAWDGSAWDKLSGVVDLSGYVPTSRKVAGKALTGDITLSASDVSAVPTTRKINGKALSADITLSASDVSALPASTAIPSKTSDITNDSGFITSEDIPTKLSEFTDDLGSSPIHTHSQYLTEHQSLSGVVPTSRKINNKALTADITLSASDVNALPDTTVIPTITDTYSATSSNGMSGKAVSSAISNKADKATSLSGYGITDAYTKSEIDGMVSAGMHYKGTKASVSALPTTGNVIGDLWNVEDTGANYAWNGTSWDKLSENIDLSGYVPTSRTINGKALTGNISLSASDVSALPSSTVIPTVTDTYSSTSSNAMSGKAVYNAVKDKANTSALNSYELKANVTSKGSSTQPVYFDADGVATAISYTIAKSVPSDAKFSDTIYTAGTGLSLSGTQFKHSNSVTAGTAGTNAATSGSTLAVPYVTYDAQGHITATGTHTHTINGFVPTSRTVNSKALSANITLSASDVGALPDTTTIPTITDTYSSTSSNGMSGKAVASALGSYELKSNVTSKGSSTQPVYFDANGVATAISYTIAKSVPSNAVFTDTNNAVTNTLNTTTKAYITGSTNAATNTGGQIFDSGVYLTTTAGKLNANAVSLGTENVTMQYNSTTKSVDFIFA